MSERPPSCFAQASRKVASEGRNGFGGVRFYITKGVQPSPEEMKAILIAAGGTVLDRLPVEGDRHAVAHGVLVISTEDEAKVWKRLHALPAVAAVLRADYVLTCVLRQALDISTGRLEP